MLANLSTQICGLDLESFRVKFWFYCNLDGHAGLGFRYWQNHHLSGHLGCMLDREGTSPTIGHRIAVYISPVRPLVLSRSNLFHNIPTNLYQTCSNRISHFQVCHICKFNFI